MAIQRGRMPRRRIGTSHRGLRANRTRQRAYETFMRSPAWKQLRRAKLASVNGLCEDCPGEHPHGASQVHHQTYARFGGEELLTDLRALCEDCHRRVHRILKQHRGMWLSLRVAAEHAMTQFGVDTRASLIASYDR